MPLLAKRVRVHLTGKKPELPPENKAKQPASVKKLIGHHYYEKSKSPGDKAQGILSPSQLTKCRRRQQFNILFVQRQQVKTTPQLQRIFHNGHNREVGLREALEAGCKHFGVHWEASVKMSIFDLLISGEADGILTFQNGDKWVVDFKTINDARFKALQAPSDDYLWQFHAYMKGLRIRQTICYYENKNNQSDEEYIVQFDDKLWEHMLGSTILYILKATQAGKLVPPDVDKCDTNECPYARVCFSSPVFAEIDRRPQAMKNRLKVITE